MEGCKVLWGDLHTHLTELELGDEMLRQAAENIDFNWQELWDPRTDIPAVSLDMAFVITPEPATLGLLLLGGLALLLRKSSAK